MQTMIPKELEEFVARAIGSGRFRSKEEAIREGLELLRTRERKLEALQADIQKGLNDIAEGRVFDLDIDDIRRRGYERLTSSDSMKS